MVCRALVTGPVANIGLPTRFDQLELWQKLADAQPRHPKMDRIAYGHLVTCCNPACIGALQDSPKTSTPVQSFKDQRTRSRIRGDQRDRSFNSAPVCWAQSSCLRCWAQRSIGRRSREGVSSGTIFAVRCFQVAYWVSGKRYVARLSAITPLSDRIPFSPAGICSTICELERYYSSRPGPDLIHVHSQLSKLRICNASCLTSTCWCQTSHSTFRSA